MYECMDFKFKPGNVSYLVVMNADLHRHMYGNTHTHTHTHHIAHFKSKF